MSIPTEILEKAKKAESTQELIDIVKDNGIEFDHEEADAYFDLLHGSAGELSDDELNDVSGGACHKKGHKVVTHFNTCSSWTCKHCSIRIPDATWDSKHDCSFANKPLTNCTNCAFCRKEKGLWLCYYE